MNKKKITLLDRLQVKYRMVIMNDDTLEERLSFKLTRMNVYIFVSTIFVILVILITSIIVFTPLKEYIPGYGDVGMRKRIVELNLQTDSLANQLSQQDLFIDNIIGIAKGDVLPVAPTSIETPDKDYSSIDLDKKSKNDSLHRAEMEEQDHYSIGGQELNKSGLEELYFFPPLTNGQISDEFKPSNEHYGVDVIGVKEDAPVKAVLDGIVVLSTWSLEDGYIIGIQHRKNLISFYKHNSVILKKVGNFVQAGDVIALMGNSGELTTGPHLHLEIWYNQTPINPAEFINFN